MKTYILKRLLLMIPTLLGVTMVVYFIVRLAPGDPIEAMIRNQSGHIDPRAMKESADKIRERLGLIDYHFLRDPLFGPEKSWAAKPTGAWFWCVDSTDKVASAAVGYVNWLSQLVRGDFGESIKFRSSGGSRSPLLLLKERISVTATLNIIAEVLIFVIAIPVGFAAARYQGRWFDRASSFVLLALYSIPAILAGTVLIGYLGMGGEGWHLFPVGNSAQDYPLGTSLNQQNLTMTFYLGPSS